MNRIRSPIDRVQFLLLLMFVSSDNKDHSIVAFIVWMFLIGDFRRTRVARPVADYAQAEDAYLAWG